MKTRKSWTINDVRQILANPIYAGIGPFPDGIMVNEIPQIIDDDTWIKAQIRGINEEGVRQHLITIRRALHETLGVKVASIAYPTWLDDSVKAIERDGAEIFFRNFLSQLRPKEKSIEVVKTIVHVENITPDLLKALSDDPNELLKLSPDLFEELVCNWLSQMGLGVERVGKHIYEKDGGVDIIAWPKGVGFPFLMAVQVKHHRSLKQKTSVGPVRDLLGVVQSLPFHAGVLVTNTTFTPNAQWIAKQKSTLIRLRDIDDIRRWLIGDFLNEYDWREMPDQIEVCPGIIVPIPKNGN